MIGVLREEREISLRHRDTQRKRPSQDGSRDWIYAAIAKEG